MQNILYKIYHKNNGIVWHAGRYAKPHRYRHLRTVDFNKPVFCYPYLVSKKSYFLDQPFEHQRVRWRDKRIKVTTVKIRTPGEQFLRQQLSRPGLARAAPKTAALLTGLRESSS